MKFRLVFIIVLMGFWLNPSLRSQSISAREYRKRYRTNDYLHTATFQNWIIDVAGKESSYLWYGFIELKGNRFAPCSFIILDTAYHYKIVADNRLIVSGSFANEGEWPTLTLSRAIKLNSSEPFFNSNEEITILKVLHQRDLQLNSEGKNRQLC